MGDTDMAAAEHEISELLLDELTADGRSLQNGKANDLAVISRTVGRTAVVVAMLARKPDGPTVDQCLAAREVLEKKIDEMRALSSGNIWLEWGRFRMGSKSGIAFVSAIIILSAAWLGSSWIDAQGKRATAIEMMRGEISAQVEAAKGEIAAKLGITGKQH